MVDGYLDRIILLNVINKDIEKFQDVILRIRNISSFFSMKDLLQLSLNTFRLMIIIFFFRMCFDNMLRINFLL